MVSPCYPPRVIYNGRGSEKISMSLNHLRRDSSTTPTSHYPLHGSYANTLNVGHQPYFIAAHGITPNPLGFEPSVLCATVCSAGLYRGATRLVRVAVG